MSDRKESFASPGIVHATSYSYVAIGRREYGFHTWFTKDTKE